MKTLRNVRSTARVATRDALLTSPTPAELAAWAAGAAKIDLGRVWTGLSSAINALEPSDRAKVLDKLSALRASTATGDAGVQAGLDQARATTTQIAAINDANKRFWNDQAGI